MDVGAKTPHAERRLQRRWPRGHGLEQQLVPRSPAAGKEHHRMAARIRVGVRDSVAGEEHGVALTEALAVERQFALRVLRARHLGSGRPGPARIGARSPDAIVAHEHVHRLRGSHRAIALGPQGSGPAQRLGAPRVEWVPGERPHRIAIRLPGPASDLAAPPRTRLPGQACREHEDVVLPGTRQRIVDVQHVEHSARETRLADHARGCIADARCHHAGARLSGDGCREGVRLIPRGELGQGQRNVERDGAAQRTPLLAPVPRRVGCLRVGVLPPRAHATAPTGSSANCRAVANVRERTYVVSRCAVARRPKPANVDATLRESTPASTGRKAS